MRLLTEEVATQGVSLVSLGVGTNNILDQRYEPNNLLEICAHMVICGIFADADRLWFTENLHWPDIV